MGLAPYFARASLAASQVIAGFDLAVFERRLSDAPVGISMSRAASRTREGQHIADLSVRLLARLYPVLSLQVGSDSHAGDLAKLARAVNPDIELADDASTGIAIGAAPSVFKRSIYAGSSGWLARVGTRRPYDTGNSRHAFGAGAAACLAAANLFRDHLLDVSGRLLDVDITFDTWGLDAAPTERGPVGNLKLPPDAALIGLGAIGHGAAWALERSAVRGNLRLVDPEVIDLGNLQRYVLATLPDVGRPKTDVLTDRLTSTFTVEPHLTSFDEFIGQVGYDLDTAATALDSARDRRAVQASLPRRVINSWTQPGDLGVVAHGTFGGPGACVECLYRAERAVPNEDELVATALGVADRLMVIRQLLFDGKPVPDDLLELVASRLHIEPARMEDFAGAPIRDLYVSGICGGALLPLGSLGDPRPEIHVPLAHQSALAGVLLASALARAGRSRSAETMSWASRIDLLRPLGAYLRQPIAARPTDCICRDRDFTLRYAAKWPPRRSGRPS